MIHNYANFSHKRFHRYMHGMFIEGSLLRLLATRGWHSTTVCTPSCFDRGQNKSTVNLKYSIYIYIVKPLYLFDIHGQVGQGQAKFYNREIYAMPLLKNSVKNLTISLCNMYRLDHIT